MLTSGLTVPSSGLEQAAIAGSSGLTRFKSLPRYFLFTYKDAPKKRRERKTSDFHVIDETSDRTFLHR